MAELDAVWTQPNTHTSRELRLAGTAWSVRDATGLTARSGVIGQKSLKVHQTGAASQSVLIDAGSVLIQGNAASQGAYVAALDAQKTLLMAAAHASLTRIDVVYARVFDATDGTGPGELWVVDKIEGTAGGGEPALPFNDAIKLAAITRAANDNVISDGEITDKRTFATALGGVIPEPLVAGIANPDSGQLAWESSTGLLKVHNGSLWRGVEEANCEGFHLIQAGPVDTSSIGTSYVDRAGQVATITKRRAGSRLKVEVECTGYITTGAVTVGFRVAVRIAGTDYDVAPNAYSATSQRQTFAGKRVLSGIGAGVQTVQLRIRATSGSGYIWRQDVNDSTSIVVTEVG